MGDKKRKEARISVAANHQNGTILLDFNVPIDKLELKPENVPGFIALIASASKKLTDKKNDTH